MIDKSELRQALEALEQMRREMILARYHYEESLEDFDNMFGPGTAQKAVWILRSRALLKKLELTHDSLSSVTEELFDILQNETEK